MRSKRGGANRRVYQNVLYTPRRQQITEKDLDLAAPSGKPKRVFLSRLRKGPRVKHMRVRKPLFGALKNEDRRFFSRVGGACLAMVLTAFILTSGLLEPATNKILLNDSGRVTAAETEAKTVGAFLEKNQILLSQGDVLVQSTDAKITEGLEVIIKRALPVYITKGSEEVLVYMLAGTVEEAIEMAGITLGENDEVYPVPSTFITSGITVNIIEVTEKTIVEEEVLYYKEITKSDATLAKGKTKVVTEGENGLERHTILVTYKNGVEVARKTVSSEVVKKRVDKVIKVGTYVPPKENPEPGGSRPPQDDAEFEDVDDTGKLTTVPTVSQIHTGNLYEHAQAPEPASTIIDKTMYIDHVTAYSWTGNPTATGTYPRIGTVAADPKRFPYGTKVYVPGYGYGRIEDTGAFRNQPFTQFDLYMDTEQDCIQWGRKRNYKVYILVSG